MGTATNYIDDSTTPTVTVTDNKVTFYSEVDGKLTAFSACAENGQLVLKYGEDQLPVDNRWMQSSAAPQIMRAPVFLSPGDFNRSKSVPFADIVTALGL